MPIANKERKQQARDTNTSSLKRRGPISALIISILLVAVIGVTIFFASGGNMIGQRAKFEKYLSDKYGQEFVVENVRVHGAGLGVKGAWRADAYPKSDPSLKFDIRRSQTTKEISVDTFLEVLWTKQGTNEVESFLSKELPSNSGYLLKIEPGDELYKSIQGETPSLETVLGSSSNLIAYSLTVRDVVDINLASEPSEPQLERALKIINFVKAKGINPASYVYYNYKDISFDGRDGADQSKYQYGIHVERDSIRSIETTADLVQYFKELE